MDHHSTYLYTCIGHGNYKFFILTLFYANVLVIFMCITMIDGLKFYISEYGDNFILTLFCIFYFLLMILTTSLVYFFLLHLYLMSNNVTTIEYKEKLKDEISKNIYFKSFCNGISSVMGFCLLWLLPIEHRPMYNGYSFEINKDIYNKILLDKLKEPKSKPKFRNGG